jgi:hypothetical protein
MPATQSYQDTQDDASSNEPPRIPSESLGTRTEHITTMRRKLVRNPAILAADVEPRAVSEKCQRECHRL